MSDISKIKGVITALVTPFKSTEIDFPSLKKLLRHQLDSGIQGLVVNGTTAESPTLTQQEVRQVFDFVKTEIAGQVPLIVGTGSNSTTATAAFTKDVEKWGATAALVVVPYYNKPPQRGLYQHFKVVAESAGIPIIAYNVPGRTITTLEPETIGQISRIANVIGIKEATGSIEFLEKTKAQVSDGFLLLSGDDATAVEFCARGGHGTIAVASHFIGREMRAAIEKNDVSDYREKYSELMKWLYIESNPIGVKAVLHWMGIISSPELRLPLVQLDQKFHKDFKACLEKLNLI